MYHATTAAILANSLMRSFEQVDEEKIRITGISWGGVTVSNVLAYDNRFAFTDSICKIEKPLIKITQHPTQDNLEVKCETPTGVSLEKVQLVHAKSLLVYNEAFKSLTNWEVSDSSISNDIITSVSNDTIRFTLPIDTQLFYLTLYDDRGLRVSTKLVEVGREIN